jgi:hypothetical protein
MPAVKVDWEGKQRSTSCVAGIICADKKKLFLLLISLRKYFFHDKRFYFIKGAFS